MHLDRFTKAVLLVIAVLLGVIVMRPILQPAPVRAQAQSGESYPFYVEPGYTTLERLWERPTLEINGVQGGGKYTVIPHVAVAHVS